MLFTSYKFIIFLSFVLIIYYLLEGELQWKFLLVASCFFYIAADPVYMLYILTTMVSVWWTACRIEKIKTKKWSWVLANVFLNIGILVILKCSSSISSGINGLVGAAGSNRQLVFEEFALPLGISFYTLQSLGYLFDVYRGTVKAERNLLKFALFVMFFPQLVQGPISRFRDLSDTLYERHHFQAKTVCYGMERILWGYFKKLVIADRALEGVAVIISDTNNYKGIYVFIGMMLYALEIYADFTGGIDITVGIAESMGICIKENFNYPHFSKSIKEYWKRWHITLGTWFTDYVFYPVSVCSSMRGLNRFLRKNFGEKAGKRIPVYLSSLAVWLLTGIWHGVGWNFVVWGLGNWIIIIISQELDPVYKRFYKKYHIADKHSWQVFQMVRTLVLISCLRAFDYYRNVPLTFQMFGTMVTEWDMRVIWDGSLLRIGLSGEDYIILLLGTLLFLVVSYIHQKKGSIRDLIRQKPYLIRFGIWYGLFITVLLFGVYGAGYDESRFIYSQF